MVPTLFIAHGAPLLAIEDNEYTQFLNQLGENMIRPKCIILFSAHWESTVQMISQAEKYKTIYDFGGFPEELYRIQYPARGDVNIARQVGEFLTQHEVSWQFDSQRGLDHGAWVVLRMLYPTADIPVIAMSVNPQLSPPEQYKIGKALSAFRENGVLIIGSGGTVHNLRAVKMQHDQERADEWALEFDEWLSQRLDNWDLDSLFHYDSLAPTARFAVPPSGNEHFIPIFYALGAANDTRQAKLLHRSYRYGNLSHSVWQFG
jgi:4,5-DOPA dioxygenase extradiol